MRACQAKHKCCVVDKMLHFLIRSWCPNHNENNSRNQTFPKPINWINHGNTELLYHPIILQQSSTYGCIFLRSDGTCNLITLYTWLRWQSEITGDDQQSDNRKFTSGWHKIHVVNNMDNRVTGDCVLCSIASNETS